MKKKRLATRVLTFAFTKQEEDTLGFGEKEFSVSGWRENGRLFFTILPPLLLLEDFGGLVEKNILTTYKCLWLDGEQEPGVSGWWENGRLVFKKYSAATYFIRELWRFTRVQHT